MQRASNELPSYPVAQRVAFASDPAKLRQAAAAEEKASVLIAQLRKQVSSREGAMIGNGVVASWRGPVSDGSREWWLLGCD